MTGKHRCPICNDIYDCHTSFGHASAEVENYVCEGVYDSPCDNHTLEELTKWTEDQGLIDKNPTYDLKAKLVFYYQGEKEWEKELISVGMLPKTKLII